MKKKEKENKQSKKKQMYFQLYNITTLTKIFKPKYSYKSELVINGKLVLRNEISLN